MVTARVGSGLTDRQANLQRRYGITEERWDSMFLAQGGACAICLRVPKGNGRRGLHVDHDHDTGEVRGLLCPPCNRSLDRFAVNLDRVLSYIDGVL